MRRILNKMSLTNDTRKIGTREPLGVKDALRKTVEDGVSASIAIAMTAGTASNYSKNEGSNIRVIYEGLGQMLASMLVDSMDLLDDAFFADLRPEFISDRLASSFFRDVNEIPSYEGDKDFRKLILDLVEAFLAGSSEQPILDLLDKRVDKQQPRISQTGLHTIGVLLNSFGRTSLPIVAVGDPAVEDHVHFVYAPKQGLGTTSIQLLSVWGDEFHVHEVVDGVVKPAAGHTHTVYFGLPQKAIQYQEDVFRLINLTKPAHVRLGRPSSLVEEEVFSLQDDPLFSLGLTFQEDLRSVAPGLVIDTVFRVIVTFRTVYINPIVYFPQKDTLVYLEVEGGSTYKRILKSEPTILKIDEGDISLFNDRTGEEFLFTIDSLGLTDIPAGDVKEGDIFRQIVEFPNYNIYYYAHIVDNNKLLLQSLVYLLNTPIIDADGLLLLKHKNIPWKTIPYPFRTYTFKNYVAGRQSFTCPFTIPNMYLGTCIRPYDVTVEVNGNSVGVASCYDSVITLYSPLDSNDAIIITAPYSNEYTALPIRLNTNGFLLNRGRTRRQRAFVNSFQLHTGSLKREDGTRFVLNRTKYHTPFTHEYQEAKILYLGANLLNQSNFRLNKRTSLLNKAKVVDYVVKVKTNAKVIVTVPTTNIISNLLLGFRPSTIISLRLVNQDDSLGAVVHGTLSKIGITLSSNEVGKRVQVEVFTRRTIDQTGDWFTGQVLSEGQPPMLNLARTKNEVSVDAVFNNPTGLSLDGEGDEARSIPVKVTETNNSGEKGEYFFYQDHFTMEFSGTNFTQVNLVDLDEECHNSLILGGGGGSIALPLPYYSGDNILDERNVLHRGDSFLCDNGVRMSIYLEDGQVLTL